MLAPTPPISAYVIRAAGHVHLGEKFVKHVEHSVHRVLRKGTINTHDSMTISTS